MIISLEYQICKFEFYFLCIENDRLSSFEASSIDRDDVLFDIFRFDGIRLLFWIHTGTTNLSSTDVTENRPWQLSCRVEQIEWTRLGRPSGEKERERLNSASGGNGS